MSDGFAVQFFADGAEAAVAWVGMDLEMEVGELSGESEAEGREEEEKRPEKGGAFGRRGEGHGGSPLEAALVSAGEDGDA